MLQRGYLQAVVADGLIDYHVFRCDPALFLRKFYTHRKRGL